MMLEVPFFKNNIGQHVEATDSSTVCAAHPSWQTLQDMDCRNMGVLHVLEGQWLSEVDTTMPKLTCV